MDKEQRKDPTLSSLGPIQKFLTHYVKDLDSSYPSSLILLIGKDNSGRKTLVKNTIADLNLHYSLIVVDLRNLKNAMPGIIKEIINSAIINSLLYRAFIYFDNFEEMLNLGEQNDQSKNAIILLIDEINKVIAKKIGPIFFAVDEKNKDVLTRFQPFASDLDTIEIRFPELTQEDQIIVWKTYLIDNHVNLKDEEIINLSAKFSFTVGQIRDSVKKSIPIAILNNSDAQHSQVSIQDIYEACYEVSNKNLDSIATSMNSHFYLDDIVLPSNGKKNLIDILNYIKNQTYVFDTWGFQRKMGLKKGVNILFSGESGTGKTMAAQIIANELKLKIYKVDYSMLISKFIGETEKNTNKIFEEAKTSNAIIFFDEADAIFGKRTEIKDSHDRYANIEVNYLLQKLEEHDEIVILASNLKQNIDDAFVRRMQFIVEFSFPTENERLIMWNNIFPLPSFYIDKQNIDFDFLAKNFKISGSMIKNIALTSAFIAFSEPNFDPQTMKISMRHIILATKKEMEKKGKPILKSDFGTYSDLLS